MESQNQRSDNGNPLQHTSEAEYSLRTPTAPSETILSKDLPVPYNISSRLPTYEEATANTFIPSSYDQLYGNRSYEEYGQIPPPNFQPLSPSTLRDSSVTQQRYLVFHFLINS